MSTTTVLDIHDVRIVAMKPDGTIPQHIKDSKAT